MTSFSSRILVFCALVAAAVLMWTCGLGAGVWFNGSLKEAQAEASARDTLVMIDFYTDWCTWCKRLDADTFSNPSVTAELATVVPLKLNAEKGGAEAATTYGVDSYPTIVFVNGEGVEVDRLLGYRPPEDFVSQIRRIRTGDTFTACLARLDEKPADLEALERAVDGLLGRSDAGAAIERIEAFHAADAGSRESECQRLMFTARLTLHEDAYERVERQYRLDWMEVPEVADTIGTKHLAQFMATLETTDNEAEGLKQALHQDAGDLLALLSNDDLGPETSLKAGRFAFDTGHYDRAEKYYRGWIDGRQRGDQAEYLNEVAWNLYLMRRDQDAALSLAREAYENEPSPNVGDTFARLLYRAGDVEEAVRIQTAAVQASGGPMAESLAAAARVMEAGGKLDDQPDFEKYPGAKKM